MSNRMMMSWFRANRRTSFLFVTCLLLGVGPGAPARSQIALFEGVRLIDGEGGAPIESASSIVQDGRFTAVGRSGELAVPAGATRIDLTGKTVMPALIDAHVHMGYRKALSFGPDNYTRENLLDTLNRFA